MTISIYNNTKNSLKYRTEHFFKKSEEVHHGLYDLSKVIYVKNSETVIFGCSIHGDFEQTPHGHLSGRGCNICANNQTSTTEEFINKSNIIHDNLYIYNETEYEGARKRVTIRCEEHGVFKQTPTNHLRGRGCPQCTNTGYSKAAIKWLNSINPDIQHAENGGEYRIPNTRYLADGYDPNTNTIYEFHGDDWHGNPNKHKLEEHCHPFNKDITAKELYDKTIEREEDIKSLGYNLVVMWEHDFKNQLNSL